MTVGVLPKLGLSTPAPNGIMERVLGEVEENVFIALPGKGGPQQTRALGTVCSPAHPSGVERSLPGLEEQGVIRSCTAL